jgi:hypothetical protein
MPNRSIRKLNLIQPPRIIVSLNAVCTLSIKWFPTTTLFFTIELNAFNLNCSNYIPRCSAVAIIQQQGKKKRRF